MGLAIPAQTTYLTRDQTLNAENARAAETEVEGWRKAGELPFPWVSPERQAQVTDTLPYPPPGTQDKAHLAWALSVGETWL